MYFFNLSKRAWWSIFNLSCCSVNFVKFSGNFLKISKPINKPIAGTIDIESRNPIKASGDWVSKLGLFQAIC